MNSKKRQRPPLVLRELLLIGFCSIELLAVPPFFGLAGFVLGNLSTLIWPDLFGLPELDLS